MFSMCYHTSTNQIYEKEHVLEFIQGNRGLPILYDGFFKSIMNPFNTPERLEKFLSSLLGQSITIVDVLTREGTQLTERRSLVIMDIIVQIEDGSFVDVKSERNKTFSFKDMKSVYLIVLMENSSKEFLQVSPHYIHRLQQIFDSGVKLNLLTNYIYISLDTFHSVGQNIDTELDAWLTFLSSDKADDIIRLVEKYPEFKNYYHDLMLFRQKPKELMNMFSEALLKIDQNTVNYMIEERAKEYEAALAQKDSIIAEKDSRIAELEALLATKNQQ